jgi:hypothetical protein
MKVVTLVPAFKVEFFEELLLSLRSQTLQPARVVISDDSKGNDFLRAARDPACRKLMRGLHVELVEGPKSGHYANIRSLVRAVSGDEGCFHVLCDDDVIYPEFYWHHLQAQRSFGTLFSFSKRWTALRGGQPCAVPPYPPELRDASALLKPVSAAYLFRTTLPYCNNWLGEFSNVVFNAGAAAMFLKSELNGVPYFGLFDLGTYLRCALQHDAVHVNQYLGAFRRSAGQHSSQVQGPVYRSSILAWLALSIAVYRQQGITESELANCSGIVMRWLRQHFASDGDVAKVLALEPRLRAGDTAAFTGEFLGLWPSFLGHLHPSLR